MSEANNRFIIMKTQLCVCINCFTVMVDDNPGGQPYFETNNINVEDMVFHADKEGSFWACPKCLTDAHLMDVETIEQIEHAATN